MYPLKFKAWDKIDNCMREVLSIDLQDNDVVLKPLESDDIYNFAKISDNTFAFGIVRRHEEVDLLQFIGIYDINKNEIYNKDIALTQEYKDKPYSKKAKRKRHIGVVKYDILEGNGFYNEDTEQWNKHKQWGAEWKIEVKDKEKFTCCSWGDFFNCEVIGNIYENPELLEQ